MDNVDGKATMPWEHSIKELGNTYTCIERDEHGRVCSGQMKVVNYKKNMWIFDIGDRHTLEIRDRPTQETKGQLSHVTSRPAYVKDDLTLQAFTNTDLADEFAYGPVTTLARDGKFNAATLNLLLLGGSETPAIVFAVPRLHVESISALHTVDPCPKADPNDDVIVPKSKVYEEHGFYFVLTEVTPCGQPVQDQVLATMQSQETCPEKNTYSVKMTPGNRLHVEIVNNLKTKLCFDMSPVMNNSFQYNPEFKYVNPDERRTLMILSSDHIMRGMCLQRVSEKVRDKTTHTFLVDEIRIYDGPPPHGAYAIVPPKSPPTQYTPPSCAFLPRTPAPYYQMHAAALVSHRPAVPHKVVPPEQENSLEKMRQDIRKIQAGKLLILDRLLRTKVINMDEYLLLTLEINLSPTRNGYR